MILTSNFTVCKLRFSQAKTYFFTTFFIIGNLLFPQLCHLIPNGGKELLPIFFFTLIGAYKYGLRVGLATAILSPLINSILSDMPATDYLPIVLTKSVLLAVSASLIAFKSGKLSLSNLLVTIILYQSTSTLITGLYLGNLTFALTNTMQSWPGMLLQLFGGYIILHFFSNK